MSWITYKIAKLSSIFYKIANEDFYNENYKQIVDDLSKENSYPFSSWFDSNGRTYLDFKEIKKDRKLDEKDIKVIEFLQSLGYENIDYLNGYAEKGGRKLRIGKILNNLSNKSSNDNEEGVLKSVNEYLLYNRIFDESNYRKLSKINEKMKVVFTQNPHDIAKMSTGRGWTSCIDLNGGKYAKYHLEEIKEGGFVAYLIDADDVDIKHPYSRIHIRRFESVYNNESIAIPEKTVYGENIPGFFDFVKDWLYTKQANKLNDTNYYSLKGSSVTELSSKNLNINKKKISNDILDKLNKDELFNLLNKKIYMGKKGVYSTVEEFNNSGDSRGYYFNEYDCINILDEIINKYIDKLNRNEFKNVIKILKDGNIDDGKYIEFLVKIFPYLEFDDLESDDYDLIFEYLPSNSQDRISSFILNKLESVPKQRDPSYTFTHLKPYLRFIKHIPDDLLDKILKRINEQKNITNILNDIGGISNLSRNVSDNSLEKISELYIKSFNNIQAVDLDDLIIYLKKINNFIDQNAISKNGYDVLKEMLPGLIEDYNELYNSYKGKTSELLKMKSLKEYILKIKQYIENKNK